MTFNVKEFEQFYSFLSGSKGSKIEVESSLSSNGNFDRHFTSYCSFAMILGDVNVRYSGARLMLHGKNKNDGLKKTDDGYTLYCPEATYEIALDHLKAVFKQKNELTLMEHYSGGVVRKTVIKGLLSIEGDSN